MYSPSWLRGLLLLGVGLVQALPAGSSATSISSTTTVATPNAEPMVPFNCPSYGYLASGGEIREVNLTTGLANRYVTPRMKDDTLPIQGLGYNPKDNLLYGFELNLDDTSQLVQIDFNGKMNRLGTKAAFTVQAGDFDARGHLWVSQREGPHWAKYDLIPGSPTWGQVVAEGDAPGPSYVVDWVYARDAGEYMWGMNSDNGQTKLYSFCLRAHQWLEVPSYAHNKQDAQFLTATFANDDEILFRDIMDQKIWSLNPSNERKYMRYFGPGKDLSYPSSNGARCLNAPRI